ncbi:MAG TPA: DciA family protein [Vicinamibacteria bacterium]|nr:DciA family protein [Vicinamibacteria bacterium]
MGLQRFQAVDLAASVFGGEAARLALLRALWPLAVGPDVARRSEVIALDNEALRVRVPDARWRRALFRMQRDILVRLRRSAGRLAPARLGFVEGHVAEAPKPQALAAAPAAVASAALLTSAGVIEDPDIRARFVDTAARYLGRAHL